MSKRLPNGTIIGQTTDSGGGGITYCLKENLIGVGLVKEGQLYFVAKCALHNLQNGLANAIKTVYGEGGIGKHNGTVTY